MAALTVYFIKTVFACIAGLLSGLFLQIVEFGQLVFFLLVFIFAPFIFHFRTLFILCSVFPITYGIVSVVCFV